MARYHTPDNRKPNAGALELVTVVEALKRFKKSIACRFDIETCAIVANIKDLFAFLQFRTDFNVRNVLFLRKFYCI